MRVDTGKSPSTASVKRLIPEQEIHINTRVYFCSSLGRREIFYMQTLSTESQVSAIETRRQLDFERFLDNQRFEEKTDLSERLGYHIHTTIDYEMRGGFAYALSDTKDRPFHERTQEAYEIGKFKFSGENAFELERLRLENEEALLVDAFGRGELPGDVLIKFSKVPDAVVDGTATVNGYRRDLLRSFVRIYYMTGEDKLSCLIFSLDSNSAAGFKEVESLVGMKLAGRSSEEILGDAKLLNWQSSDLQTQVEVFAENIILRYDQGIRAETGRRTYAGSGSSDMENALAVVDKHSDLFEQHWLAISEVQGRVLSNKDREDFLENVRRKTAAAIKLRENGTTISSIGDEDVAAEAQSGEYGRECATNGMNQTEDLTKDWEKLVKSCPICGKPNVVATKTGDTITGDCGCWSNVCTGAFGRATLQKKPRPTVQTATEVRKPAKAETFDEKNIKQIYGDTAQVQRRKAFGDEIFSVVDRQTGDVLNPDLNRTN